MTELLNLRMSPTLTGENGIHVSTGKVFSFPTHSHAYYELLLYQPFDGRVWVNERAIFANRPFALLMTPADLHRVEVIGQTSSDFIKIAFTVDIYEQSLPHRPQGGLLVFVQDAVLPHLFTELVKKRSPKEQIVLLGALLLLLSEQGEALPSLPAPAANALIARAVAIMGDEFQSDLTLAALANRLNVSYQHLSACFSKHLGLSFSAYLRELRLRHARALLERGDRRITEVCFDCGYRNLSHFLRSFKKRFGATPKEYQKRQK